MRKVIAFFLLVLITFPSLTVYSQRRSLLKSDRGAKAAPQGTSFANFEAFSDGQGVFLRWNMVVETDNIGFYIYRVGENGKARISEDKIVEGSSLRFGSKPIYGANYTYFDVSGRAGDPYIIEAVERSGTRVSTPAFGVQFVADIEPLAGLSSQDMIYGAKTATGNVLRNELLPGKELAAEIEANRNVADPDMHRTVISQPGVKIGVRKDGICRVPVSQLASAGFDTGSDPANWQLYLEGVEQHITIAPDNTYIEFFAKGIDTVESDIRVYNLIAAGTPGKRMATRTVRPSFGTVVSPSFPLSFKKEENTSYIDTIRNGPTENYWGRGLDNIPTTVTFTLTGVDYTRPTVNATVKFQGYSAGDHGVELMLNGTLLPAITGTGDQAFEGVFPIDTALLVEGTNSLQMRTTAATNDYSFFDSITLELGRRYLAANDRLAFFTHNYRIAKVEGFSTPNITVYDTTVDGSPVIVEGLAIGPTGSTFGFDIPAARGRVYYAIETAAVDAPFSVTPNDPAMLEDPANAGQLLIITHKNFMAQAQTWAAYRAGQGTVVKVIDVQEIFDEFSYGVQNSPAMELFLQYAVANWTTPPQYVLLIGDASYDPRNYEGLGYFNLVPTRIVNTIFTETASDEALADFDNDGLAEVAIGRIASRTTTGITNAFNKMVTWENNLVDPLSRGALFASDYPVGYDFEAMNGRLRDQLPAGMPKVMVFRGQTGANTTLINEMNLGKYVINFAGHGTTGTWGGNPVFFNIFSVSQLTNVNNPSLYTMLTCLNGYFHHLRNESFAEVLTRYGNGGAVAAWSSSGLTTPDVQEIMGGRFYNQLGLGNITRLGDLVRDAKQTIPTTGDVRLSWVLIGDPMLKMYSAPPPAK